MLRPADEGEDEDEDEGAVMLLAARADELRLLEALLLVVAAALDDAVVAAEVALLVPDGLPGVLVAAFAEFVSTSGAGASKVSSVGLEHMMVPFERPQQCHNPVSALYTTSGTG